MKTVQSSHNEFAEKKLVALLIVAGIAFSGSSFLMFNDTFAANSNNILDTNSEICKDGFCNISESNSMTFVQLSEDVSPDSTIGTNNEMFSNVNFEISHGTTEYKLSGNKATLFAQKDSFIREGVKNMNEGSNEILRVMGSGSTNNRALIAFSQAEVESVVSEQNLESATLKLFIETNNGKWGDGQSINIHRLNSNWDEGIDASAPISNLIGAKNGVTWNCSTDVENCNTTWNGGVFDENPTDSVFISNQIQNGYWIKFDVTQDVNDFLSGSTNYGWIIMKNDEDASGQINFAAREAQSNAPELVMVFSK